jgi:sirohydrochlorin cobaltochelatase
MTSRLLPAAGDLGLLLIGHGTRDEQGLREFRHVAQRLAAEAADVAVEPCFLELAEPSIQQGAARLIERGARHMIVLPLLLFAAGHAQHDIPRAVAAALDELTHAERSRQPVSVRQAPVLGCHPDIIELSARRYNEALARDGGSPNTTATAKTLLLMVGRGSNEAEANAEFARFARLRWERQPVGWLETCFVAMARPTLDEGLQMAAAMPFERIVVQPHLLFSGELLQGIHAAVAGARGRAPDRQWIVTEHLGIENRAPESPGTELRGSGELLVRALLSRAGLAAPNRAQPARVNEPPASGNSGPAAQSVFDNCLAGRADLALPEPSV